MFVRVFWCLCALSAIDCVMLYGLFLLLCAVVRVCLNVCV